MLHKSRGQEVSLQWCSVCPRPESTHAAGCVKRCTSFQSHSLCIEDFTQLTLAVFSWMNGHCGQVVPAGEAQFCFSPSMQWMCARLVEKSLVYGRDSLSPFFLAKSRLVGCPEAVLLPKVFLAGFLVKFLASSFQGWRILIKCTKPISPAAPRLFYFPYFFCSSQLHLGSLLRSHSPGAIHNFPFSETRSCAQYDRSCFLLSCFSEGYTFPPYL